MKDNNQYFGIKEACSENWAGMTPTEKGAHCAKCALEVYDFSNSTSAEIRTVLQREMGNRVCGRMRKEQELELSGEYLAWKSAGQVMRQVSLVSFIAVFGLTLFSCTSPQQEKTIQEIQRAGMEVVEARFQEIITEEPVEVEEISGEEAVLTIPEPEIMVMGGIRPLEYIWEEEEPEPEPVRETEVVNIHEMMLGDIALPSDYHEVVPTPVEADENGVPIPEYYTVRAYPNPTAGEFTVLLELPEKGKYTITLINEAGEFIGEVYSGKLNAGTRRVGYSIADQAPGIYFLRVESRKFKNTIRLSKI